MSEHTYKTDTTDRNNKNSRRKKFADDNKKHVV